MALRQLKKAIINGNVVNLTTFVNMPVRVEETGIWYINELDVRGSSYVSPQVLNIGDTLVIGNRDAGFTVKLVFNNGNYYKTVNSTGTTDYGLCNPNDEYFIPYGTTKVYTIDYDYSMCIVVDDTLEQGVMFLYGYHKTQNVYTAIYGIGFTTSGLETEVLLNEIYNTVLDSQPPVPNFKSIAYFTDLHSHRNLTMIKDASTNHGEPVTGATYADFNIIDVKQPNSDIETIVRNVGVGGEVTYCFTRFDANGNHNRGTIKRLADDVPNQQLEYEFRYYIGGTYDSPLTHYLSIDLINTDNSKWYLAFLVDTENELAMPSIVHAYDNGTYRNYDYNQTTFTNTVMHLFYLWLANGYGLEVPTDPFIQGGDSEEGGGEGDFNDHSDEIGFADVPTFSAVSSGLVKIFTPSKSQLSDLSDFLWSGLFDIDTFKKLFSDPMNCLLNLMVIPYNVPYEQGTPPNLIFGNVDTNIPMFVASSQYLTVDCGTVDINEYYGAYLDYAPYTKVNCYLPYIGIVALNTDDVMGKSLHILYKVDILTGACIATIKAGEEVLYHFSGNCGCTIPLSSNSYSSTIGSIISIATTAISVGATIASEGATAPLIAGGVASTANNVMSSKPQVARSGSLGSFAGFMDIQKPYLIFEIPSQCKAKNQQIYKGYPSHIAYKLADISGYTEIESIHLENMTCTDTELSEIESLLMTGVII